MKLTNVVRCAAVALVLTGCKTVPQNPAAFNRQKLAVASWFSEQKIISNNAGGIAAIQSMAGDMGKDLLDASYASDFQTKLQKIIGGEWVPTENVVKAASYATLPEPRLKNFFYAPLGMRPMELSDDAQPAMAQLAKEIGAEAVVGVENRWTVSQDSKGQYCMVTMTIHLVDDKGTLLYDKRVGSQAHAQMGGIQMAAELAGALSPDNTKAACKNATVVALDKFAEAWNEAKATAAAAPAPAPAPAPAAEAKPADAKTEGAADPKAEPK